MSAGQHARVRRQQSQYLPTQACLGADLNSNVRILGNKDVILVELALVHEVV